MRLTAVRNRVSAAAAEPRVPAPKTRQSIRLDEVRRLADVRAQELGYLAPKKTSTPGPRDAIGDRVKTTIIVYFSLKRVFSMSQALGN